MSAHGTSRTYACIAACPRGRRERAASTPNAAVVGRRDPNRVSSCQHSIFLQAVGWGSQGSYRPKLPGWHIRRDACSSDVAQANAKQDLVILAGTRAAQTFPWEPARVSLYRTIFPQMTLWLLDEERSQLWFEFEAPIARLEVARAIVRYGPVCRASDEG